MNTSYYDVVILGMRLEALVCGALLAKRGFRVLLLRQDDPPSTYTVGGLVLPRNPSSFLAAHSPVVRRIFAELALHQLFRRRARAVDPAFQAALPHHRFDLRRADDAFSAEIAREFPEIQRPVEDFHRNVVRNSNELDRILDRKLVWPPEGFFERRELNRAITTLPYDRNGQGVDPLAEIADDHPFRVAVEATMRFATDLDTAQLPPLARVRLYDARLRGSVVFEGGDGWLTQALLEKIQTYSGDVRPRQRARAILLKRGQVTAVRLHGSGEEIGCGFVIAACDLARLIPLVEHRSTFEELFERSGEPQTRWYRYVLNVVLNERGLPEGMARDVFFVRDPRKPLEGPNLLHVQTQDRAADAPETETRRVLTVQSLIPRRSIEERSDYVEGLRERLLASLEDLVPFLRRHLLLIDSPHDGKPPFDTTVNREVAAGEEWLRAASTMESIYSYPVRSALGFCALPTRMPTRNLLLCNGQVAPGLGMEGRLLSAASAARIVTQAYRKKAWMRRSRWSKIEI